MASTAAWISSKFSAKNRHRSVSAISYDGLTSRLLKALVARDMAIKESNTGQYRRGPGLTKLACGMDYAPHTRKALAHAWQERMAILRTYTLSQRQTVYLVQWPLAWPICTS